MRLFARRQYDDIDRRRALEGIPVINPGVKIESDTSGNSRVSLMLRRGAGIFDWMRPKESPRSYDLDEFGTYVIKMVDGKKTVLEMINAFEERFKMSRREVELSVVAFLKLLMQRHVLSLTVEGGSASNMHTSGMSVALALFLTVGMMLSSPISVLRGESKSAQDILNAVSEISKSSRAPGTPGNLALQEMVIKRFKASGHQSGNIQFNAPAYEPGLLSLRTGEGESFELQAMHPTLVRPGNFKQESFEANLIYLGKGEASDLVKARGLQLDGAVAVMDYRCGDRWLELFSLGLSGFIFVGDGTEPYFHAKGKVYHTEVAVPRYFIDGKDGRRLIELCQRKGKVSASFKETPSRWKQAILKNPWVLIPGSDTELSEKVIVITAALDANSVIPERAFGAQRAVNLHLLLEMLEEFKKKPPKHSVMLVGVNAQSYLFQGRRMLAWHLLSNPDNVEELRDEIGRGMRLTKLHADWYGRLKLDPVPKEEKPHLRVMIEVMWVLDRLQEERLGDKKDQWKLDLDQITEDDVKQALSVSRAEIKASYEGWLGTGGRDQGELEAEKKEEMALFDSLKGMSHDELIQKARKVLTVFEDEKLFESWRSQIDDSLKGERIYIKTKLQDELMAMKNRVLQDLMVTSSERLSNYDEVTRKAKMEELKQKKSDVTKVLVLFNKMDLGVGRSRTYYRQIAESELHRTMLKEIVDGLVSKFRKLEKQYDGKLTRDTQNDAIRDALGTKKVGLVVPLELDGHGKKIGLLAFRKQSKGGVFEGFGALCNEIGTSIDQEKGTSYFVDILSGENSEDSSYYFGGLNQPLEHYVSASFKTPAVSLKTAHANYGRLFGPYDTAAELDAESLHSQYSWSREFLSRLCSQEDALSPKNLKTVKEVSISWSINLRTYSLEQFTGKPIPTKEIGGALVALYRREFPAFHDPVMIHGDVMNAFPGISNDAGNLYVYGLARSRPLVPIAYQMDSDFREVLFTIDQGRVQSSKQITSNVSKGLRSTLPLFECREFVMRSQNDPTKLGHKPIKISRFWPKSADGQSDPEKFGVHGAKSLSPARSHRTDGPVGFYLYRKRAELAQDRLMVITEDRRTILGATQEFPEGDGFANDEEFPVDPFLAASQDMSTLNRFRSEGMQGVVNQMLDEFMDRNDDLNEEALASKAQGHHLEYLSARTEALGTSVKAYNELRGMNDDMLKAIIAYMALMIPFCYFLQKLLFNFARMEHELGGFCIFFIGIFVLFRNIHPAFSMAMSAEAIFIAFILGAIGFFTTAVLHSRFKEEMNLLFRGVAGFGENAAAGTIGQTAVMIGVQNMRRRRVRTTLTTATIILVVFTMLAFSSVSKKASPTLLPQASTAPYTGIFYHWPVGSPMDDASFRVVDGMYGDVADVQPRRLVKRQRWSKQDPEESFRLARVGEPESYINLKNLTGLVAEDIILKDSMALTDGTSFSSSTAREILLPSSAADALGLGAADVGKARLEMAGETWLLKGLINDQRYRLARDLNPNLSLVPMVSPPQTNQGEDADSLEMEIPEMDKVLMETSEMAIIPEGTAAELGGKVTSVSIVFPETIEKEKLSSEVQRLLAITDTRFFFGSRTPFKLNPEAKSEIKPGTYYVGSGYRTAIGGLSMLIIPLIIAGSIVLNTMLGTVYERKSEIAVFNAIGLNPTHIFTFFLAEAFVYSLLGAVGGYLIGQLLAMGLKASDLVTGVNINFSSLMVVYAIAFTMALVMLSTIYPGWVATRVAVPSGKRKWSMPDNDGNSMNVVFPFIYRSHLAPGALVYLHHFFESFSDQSLGDIVAQFEGSTIRNDEDGKPVRTLTYLIALAPYDLGVTQRVTFTSGYDEEVRSYRMHMKVERVSGQETNWVTTNKPFLERMRKYLIRWRNIDPTRQNWYVEQADNLFEKEADVVHG